MTGKLFVCLGKTGDILNLLPILHADALAGQRPTLLVAKKYAPLLDGVSYVEPMVFDGDPSNLAGAVMEAKATGLPFHVAQVCGPPEMTRDLVYRQTKEFKESGKDYALTDCWQKESYRCAGCWGLWRKQPPLVFDRRSPDRETALAKEVLTSKRKAILVHTAGETCPFQHKRLLMELIRGRFRQHYQIIDLDEVKADQFYDLLGLYDKAECLIAADSAPLHLAQACKRLPVVALANDKSPEDGKFSLWRGAAWRPNHIFYCRYRDFGARAMEMIDAIEEIGMPGGRFQSDRSKRSFIHVWSGYEVNEKNRKRHEAARVTWRRQYQAGQWIGTPVELGSCGRDSKVSPINDPSRYPFVHDVIQAAEMRAKDDDVIVLTPSDVSFNGALSSIDHFPAFGCRTERTTDGDTHNPRVDFFAFTKKWWQEHRKSYPEFILGPDGLWSRALAQLIRTHGGKEVDGATFREAE